MCCVIQMCYVIQVHLMAAQCILLVICFLSSPWDQAPQRHQSQPPKCSAAPVSTYLNFTCKSDCCLNSLCIVINLICQKGMPLSTWMAGSLLNEVCDHFKMPECWLFCLTNFELWNSSHVLIWPYHKQAGNFVTIFRYLLITTSVLLCFLHINAFILN